MKQSSKSMLLVSLFLVVLNASFGKTPVEIRLTLQSDGTLVDPGTTEVDKDQDVVWVNADSRIEWFKIVGAGHPFTVAPPNTNIPSRLQRRVRANAPECAWKYTIKYRLRDGRELELDPKIAVKPEPLTFLDLVLLVLLGVISIAAGIFYSNWRTAKARLK